MTKMTRSQVQDVVRRFAIDNPSFHAALLAESKATAAKPRTVTIGGVILEAIIDMANTLRLASPSAPSDGQLADTDLEGVAGGKREIEAVRSV